MIQIDLYRSVPSVPLFCSVAGQSPITHHGDHEAPVRNDHVFHDVGLVVDDESDDVDVQQRVGNS